MTIQCETYNVEVYPNGDIHWFQNGERHKTNGPAIEWLDGTKFWYQHGKLHRDSGPAIEFGYGSKYWYKNGKRHRIDGPAIEYYSGYIEYWIDGIFYNSKENFDQRIQELKLNHGQAKSKNA